MGAKRKCVALTMKGKVNIVSRLKDGKWEEELTEEYGVGILALSDIKISAKWILKFVFLPAVEDDSSTGQIVRRAENDKVGDAVYNFFLTFEKPDTFTGQFFVKRRSFSPVVIYSTSK